MPKVGQDILFVKPYLHFSFFLSIAYYTQNIKLFSHFGNFYFIQPNIFQFQKHIGYEAQPLFGACTFWVLLGVWVGFLPSLVLIDQLRFRPEEKDQIQRFLVVPQAIALVLCCPAKAP